MLRTLPSDMVTTTKAGHRTIVIGDIHGSYVPLQYVHAFLTDPCRPATTCQRRTSTQETASSPVNAQF